MKWYIIDSFFKQINKSHLILRKLWSYFRSFRAFNIEKGWSIKIKKWKWKLKTRTRFIWMIFANHDDNMSCLKRFNWYPNKTECFHSESKFIRANQIPLPLFSRSRSLQLLIWEDVANRSLLHDVRSFHIGCNAHLMELFDAHILRALPKFYNWKMDIILL